MGGIEIRGRILPQGMRAGGLFLSPGKKTFPGINGKGAALSLPNMVAGLQAVR